MGVSSSPSCSHAHEVPAARGRFAEDFDTIALLGSGEFGHVLKCRNKMDACDYAVRQLARILRTTSALNFCTCANSTRKHIIPKIIHLLCVDG